MSLPNIIVLIVAFVGYTFCSTLDYTRFRSKVIDWSRQLGEATLVGVGILIVSRLATYELHRLTIGRVMERELHAVFPFEYAGTFAAALFVAWTVPRLVNALLGRGRQLNAVLLSHGNALLRLLFQATQTQEPVRLTLQSREVYAGYVVEISLYEGYLTLLPLIKGYDAPAEAEIKYLRNLISENVGGVAAEKSIIVLPLSDIRIGAFLFGDGAYGSMDVGDQGSLAAASSDAAKAGPVTKAASRADEVSLKDGEQILGTTDRNKVSVSSETLLRENTTEASKNVTGAAQEGDGAPKPQLAPQ